MWWLDCFKAPNTVDTFEAETNIALEVSRYDAEIQEAQHLSLALHESSCQQGKEEEAKRARELVKKRARELERKRARELKRKRARELVKKRARELEKDTQIANIVAKTTEKSLKEKGKRKQSEEQVKKDGQIANDVAKTAEKSLKEKGKRKQFEEEQVKKDGQIAKDVKTKESEEQVKKDGQIAKDLRRKQFSGMETEEGTRLRDNSVLVKEGEQIAKTVEKSLKEKGKRKQFVEEQVKNGEEIAKELQAGLRDNNFVSSEQFAKTAEKRLKEKGKRKQFEEEQVKNNEQIAKDVQKEDSSRLHDESVLDDIDEQLAKTREDSFKEKGKGKQSKDEVKEDEKLPKVDPPPSICGGCNLEIKHGESVDISGVLWHPDCLWCEACHKLISIHQVENHVSNVRGSYHKFCYERYCYICKEKKMRKYHEHPFWKERYCPSHESDGTPKCCSCERLEPRETNYVMLGDTRLLCLECMESALMDSHECQHLHFEIREFFEGLNMKIEKEFPFLLVEKDALNKAEKEEKIDNQYEVVTRGICLSEEQIVTSVSKARRMGPKKEVIEKVTESLTVFSHCEVTAILILYGLPRLLTGYILVHEMMHAYLRLNGHRKLNQVNEEGICQVLGHMWLESQRYAPIDPAIAAEASSSNTPPAVASASSKKGKWSCYEKKLVDFCKNQIETDESRVYGDGFRKVNKIVTNSSPQEALKEILRLG